MWTEAVEINRDDDEIAAVKCRGSRIKERYNLRSKKGIIHSDVNESSIYNVYDW